MLCNEDYVYKGKESELDRAIEQNGKIILRDKSYWFYKLWKGLSDSLPAGEGYFSIWIKEQRKSARSEYEAGNKNYPAAIPFTEVKEDIEKTQLFKAFQKLPKGALLHVHSAAALSAEKLLELLDTYLDKDKLYIGYNENVESQGFFFFMNGIGETKYKRYEKYDEYVEREGNTGKLKMKNWLTIGKHTDNVTYIWNKFNEIFRRTSDLFEDEEFYYEYHRRFFLECLYDRIDYVELRCGFQNFTRQSGEDKEKTLGQSPKFLDVLMKAKDAAVEAYLGEEREDKWELPYGDMELGVILCARRDLDTENLLDRDKLMKKIDTAIAWKKEEAYKDLIKGFDFVSEEDRGKTSYTYYKDIIYGKAFDGYLDVDMVIDYDPSVETDPVEGDNPPVEKKTEYEKRAFAAARRQLEEMRKTEAGRKQLERLSEEFAEGGQLREKYNGENAARINQIELMLHAGESLWMEQENIIDAKIASKSRLGHGFQMLQYPGVLMSYQSREPDRYMPCGPVLEVCPISNQMLRYFPDLRNHYALMLMKLGVPCVIANDDPQLLENPGLSYDFWEICMASDGELMLIKGLVFTAFVFQYQHRIKKDITTWSPAEYRTCREEFEGKYWEPYIALMGRTYKSEYAKAEERIRLEKKD